MFFGEIFHQLQEYEPPKWCKELLIKPKYRIPLAMRPTPVHPWRLDIPDGFEVHIKRDDLAGCTLSGNKIRELEFILADAKSQDYTDIITGGTTQSNHARATMIAAKEIGLECHLVLVDLQENCRATLPSGNFLLIEAAEPNIYILPSTEFSNKNVVQKMNIIAADIKKTPGRKAYCIPLGGNIPLGIYGYIHAWEEMIKQGIPERFDDVVLAAGSMGTSIGIAIGNYLTGGKLRIHAIIVSIHKALALDLIKKKLQDFGITDATPQDLMNVIDGHIGKGYSIYDEKDLEFYKEVAKTTGIYCDPVYVGKALKGFIWELNNNPEQFNGKRILFIHTGGVFSLMETESSMMMRDEKGIAKIRDWAEAFPEE